MDPPRIPGLACDCVAAAPWAKHGCPYRGFLIALSY